MGLLSRIRSWLDLKAARCVYNTLIEPVLSYTDTAWGELSAASSTSLQRLQNCAARIIQRRHSSSTLGWFDLETNRKMHKCILAFTECLHGLVPPYLCYYFIRNYDVHSYNTRRKTSLNLALVNVPLDF